LFYFLVASFYFRAKEIYMKIIGLYVFLFFSSYAYAGEALAFDMFLMGKKIGELNIQKELNTNGEEIYTLQSQARAKVLWIDRSQQTNYKVIYKNGKLFQSSHEYIDHPDKSSSCTIKLIEDKYQVTHNGRCFFLKESPRFSVLAMYFKEPIGIKKLLYEVDGTFSEIKNTAPNTYVYKSSDGNVNTYIFKDGKIQEIEVQVGLITVKIKRKN